MTPAQPARLADLLESSSIIDLTHPFDAETIYWPTADGFKLTVDARGYTEGGYYYAANSFCAAEHGGTHLDAPLHFAEGGWSVDRIPVERLIGPAVRIDVSSFCLKDADYEVTIGDFQSWESRNGSLPEGVIVLLYNGLWAPLASPRPVPGDGSPGRRGRSQSPLSGVGARGGPLAGGEPFDQGHRSGHCQHRLRPVQAVSVPIRFSTRPTSRPLRM